jgi:hypothetical protein
MEKIRTLIGHIHLSVTARGRLIVLGPSTSFTTMSNQSLNDSETPLAIAVARDAFSSGQVGSKIWLCAELETVIAKRTSRNEAIWIYGGWHGLLGFMLLTRDRLGAKSKVRSFDVDPACADIANAMCENWVWREWRFRAFTKDCNDLNPGESGEFGPQPTIVINTSVEHFGGREWFEKIPEGTVVVLQAADFEHDGAVSLYESESKLAEAFPLREKLFSGRLNFDYGSWSFSRLMLIGVR